MTIDLEKRRACALLKVFDSAATPRTPIVSSKAGGKQKQLLCMDTGPLLAPSSQSHHLSVSRQAGPQKHGPLDVVPIVADLTTSGEHGPLLANPFVRGGMSVPKDDLDKYLDRRYSVGTWRILMENTLVCARQPEALPSKLEKVVPQHTATDAYALREGVEPIRVDLSSHRKCSNWKS